MKLRIIECRRKSYLHPAVRLTCFTSFFRKTLCFRRKAILQFTKTDSLRNTRKNKCLKRKNNNYLLIRVLNNSDCISLIPVIFKCFSPRPRTVTRLSSDQQSKRRARRYLVLFITRASRTTDVTPSNIIELNITPTALATIINLVAAVVQRSCDVGFRIQSGAADSRQH